MTQRDYMRQLYRQLNGSAELVVQAYAIAEKKGEVDRGSNAYDLDALDYARRLYNDGIRKGWIEERPRNSV